MRHARQVGMTLADTSAWVEYDRATGSAVHHRVAELIAGEGPLSVAEPVIVKVLAGARSAQRAFGFSRPLSPFSPLRVYAAPDVDPPARTSLWGRGARSTPRRVRGLP